MTQCCFVIQITVIVLRMSEDDSSAIETPVRYRPNMFSTVAGRLSRVVLQTSDSSGEDDEIPPRSKARSKSAE